MLVSALRRFGTLYEWEAGTFHGRLISSIQSMMPGNNEKAEVEMTDLPRQQTNAVEDGPGPLLPATTKSQSYIFKVPEDVLDGQLLEHKEVEMAECHSHDTSASQSLSYDFEEMNDCLDAQANFENVHTKLQRMWTENGDDPSEPQNGIRAEALHESGVGAVKVKIAME